MPKPDKRKEIILATLEVIAERGFHGAPIAMIADRAKVSAGSIYCYFETKDDLICETYDCLEGLMLSSITAHCPEGRPIREHFLYVGLKLVNHFLASPKEFRFFEQYQNSPYGTASRRGSKLDHKNSDTLTELFDAGLQQQIIKDLPLPILFALAFAPLMAICRDNILQNIEMDEAVITRTIEACWDSVRR